MLAVAWPWDSAATRLGAPLSKRLGASLCAGIGGHAVTAVIGGTHFAYRPLRPTGAARPTSRPAVLPDGKSALFHGYFDNAPEIAQQLGATTCDLSLLYGLAVERWGDDAERRIIGEYCAVIADPAEDRLRLARSPLRAPPLYYSHQRQLTVAASVPRALFAVGVERRLNDTRIADGLLRNFTDEEASPFRKIGQVPTGAVVELKRGQPRVLRKWYDIVALPFHEQISDAEAIEKAGELLNEGVRGCLAGFDRPGATLSGGLDSPQVALRALATLPPGEKLPTFTFHPEAGFDGRVPPGVIGDERPFVEALAALHDGLEPHFTDNAGRAHDYRCAELFHLIGDPAGLTGTYVFHGILDKAREVGCDVLLLAYWGNLTFSDRGECGFVEYLLTGRWRELWLALQQAPTPRGSLSRRFVSRSLAALLPDRLWTPLRRLVLRRQLPWEHAQPLSAEFRRTSSADNRLKQAGIIADRHQPWNRRHSRKLLFGNGDPAPFYQGLEQMYGIALRDPAAYRPFVEFCLGLPTRMFMRGGEMRWLARQMARNLLPEEQRLNRLNGWWDADWHLRIGRRREEFLLELDRLADDPDLGRMFDVQRLRRALDEWPNATETEPARAFAVQLAVPTALLTARFIKWVEGRND